MKRKGMFNALLICVNGGVKDLFAKLKERRHE
jgi:hypothetical protein